MNPKLVADLQRRAATIRCRWVIGPQHVLLQRRIGTESDGYWLTVSRAATFGAPDPDASYSALAGWTEVLAGRLTLGQLVNLLCVGLPVPNWSVQL